jgi:hypothetical protein
LGWISKANRKTGVTKKVISDQKKWDTNPQPCSPDTTNVPFHSQHRPIGQVPFQASNLPAMALQICTMDFKPLPEDFSWTTQRVGQGLSNE